jgi:hypothetical protein
LAVHIDMQSAAQAFPGFPGPALLLTLLLCSSLLTPDEQAVLQVESRCESWYEGERSAGGTASSRLLLDYAGLDGGLVASRREDGSYLLSGGLGLPCLKMGSVSLEGPLRELRSPPQAAPLSGIYEARPSATLDRGWRAASRHGLAIGIPGRVWLSCTSVHGAEPEAAAAVEIGEQRGLAASAVLLYSRIAAAESDEWILPQGMPPEGEILMGGLRLAKSCSACGFSGFAGASLHPLLPAGFYLRGKLFVENRLIDAGGRLGWTNRWYRSPVSALPPYLASGGIEIRFFPGLSFSPTGSISGELDHPPSDGSQGADWKGAAAAGCEWEGRSADISLKRSLELRRLDGELLAEELLQGSVDAGVPLVCELRLMLKSSIRLEDGRADTLRLGLRYAGVRLKAELWGGFSSGGEFGERLPPREQASGGRIEFEKEEWTVSLDVAIGECTEWRFTGGRRFSAIK